MTKDEREYLKVEIPKRFESDLRKRFDLRRFGKDRINRTACPLCEEFKFNLYSRICIGCPFHKYESGMIVGCVNWEKEITTNTGIRASNYRVRVFHKEAFKKFKKSAMKLIKFI